MTPLHFITLNNSYQEPMEYIRFRDELMPACRAAMAGAVATGMGQLVADRCRFRVLGVLRPPDLRMGGVWRLVGTTNQEVVRLAICRDANAEYEIWTAAHGDRETITSRPTDTPPPLPWAAIVYGSMVADWGGPEAPPFVNAGEHMARAWWQLCEAGCMGW